MSPELALLSLNSIAFVGDRWSPGIGDPSLIGWLTVVAYFACGWMCFRARRSAASEPRRVQLAWLILAVGTALLGLNKQLDLQSLLTQFAKDMAKEGDWYEDRRVVQVWFIRGILLGGGAALLTGAWAMRDHAKAFLLPGIGAVFIVAFVMIRAASFHEVDHFLRSGPGGIRMNWVLELGGIWLMAWGARRFHREHLGRTRQ
jgi:hypothetical protein